MDALTLFVVIFFAVLTEDFVFMMLTLPREDKDGNS